jgi:iron complex outermembrane receptor protein
MPAFEKGAALFLASFILFHCVPVAAEESEKLFTMEEVVVTATPDERKIKEITSTVGVIDEAEIETSNSDYVMDVIGSMPGVYIRRDAIYGRQDITIRGLGSNLRRLQVLVDGRPEKMSLFGCTVSQTLPLSNVERIEVVRGPESVLYGTDAMGGVINIITKRKRDPGYESNALLSYGGYGTMHSLLRHSGNRGAFDYYLSYDHKQSDGHRANSDYGADFFSIRTGYAINHTWRAEVSGQYFTDDGNSPGPRNNPYVNKDSQQYERYSWDADLMAQWNRSHFLLTVYDNSGEHRFHMPTISDYWHSKDRTLGINTRYTREVVRRNGMKDTITAGYEYQNQWAEPQADWIAWARATMPAKFMNFGDYGRDNHDIYAFNELIKDRWINTLGIRGHWDDRSEQWEALPEIGLLYSFSDRTTARAKISKGFRQPRFSELYLYPAHNEDLEPEQVWSYEAAISHSITPWLNASINPFYMDVKNLIQTVANSTPPPASINRNSGKFVIKGLETGIEASPVRSVRLSINYTYTGIEDGPPGNPHVNRQGEPEHTIDADARYFFGKFTLSADSRFVAGLYDSDLLAGGAIKRVDNFLVVGMKGSYRIHRNLDCFLGVENLLNEDYEQIPGYPMPGTRLIMGLKTAMEH